MNMVIRMSDSVTESRRYWTKLFATLTDTDRELYAILQDAPFPSVPSMENVFLRGRCQQNCFWASWVLNGRTLACRKWELVVTRLHAALKNKHNDHIMDPTAEAHPDIALDKPWKQYSIVMLTYESFGTGNYSLPLASPKELRGAYKGAWCNAFLDAAEEAERIRVAGAKQA